MSDERLWELLQNYSGILGVLIETCSPPQQRKLMEIYRKIRDYQATL